jgi:hypothetical protein
MDRFKPSGCTTKFNLLKPTGYVMHQHFNIQQLYVLPTHCIYVFCIYLRTNSDLCHLQHKLIGFYNREEKCLLRGTNWVFNYNQAIIYLYRINPFETKIKKLSVSFIIGDIV